MNNDVKYYIISLKNIFLEGSSVDLHFGLFENGKYIDLLTGKEIYMINENDFSMEDFINSNCKLIAINKEEYPSDKIALFLKFMTNDAKEVLIEEIEKMENSIKRSLSNDKNLEKNKVKIITKYGFLKNY